MRHAHIRAEWSRCVARQPYISIPRAHPVSGAAKLGDMKLASALCAPPQTLINQLPLPTFPGSQHHDLFRRQPDPNISGARPYPPLLLHCSPQSLLNIPESPAPRSRAILRFSSLLPLPLPPPLPPPTLILRRRIRWILEASWIVCRVSE